MWKNGKLIHRSGCASPRRRRRRGAPGTAAPGTAPGTRRRRREGSSRHGQVAARLAGPGSGSCQPSPPKRDPAGFAAYSAARPTELKAFGEAAGEARTAADWKRGSSHKSILGLAQTHRPFLPAASPRGSGDFQSHVSPATPARRGRPPCRGRPGRRAPFPATQLGAGALPAAAAAGAERRWAAPRAAHLLLDLPVLRDHPVGGGSGGPRPRGQQRAQAQGPAGEDPRPPQPAPPGRCCRRHLPQSRPARTTRKRNSRRRHFGKGRAGRAAPPLRRGGKGGGPESLPQAAAGARGWRERPTSSARRRAEDFRFKINWFLPSARWNVCRDPSGKRPICPNPADLYAQLSTVNASSLKGRVKVAPENTSLLFSF